MVARLQHKIYSIDNEGKSVVAERFIRTLKTKIYKYMTEISKNVYIDKLADIANKYNNIYHSTIKMKPVNVTKNNKEDAKFQVGGSVSVKMQVKFVQKVTLQIGLMNIL